MAVPFEFSDYHRTILGYHGTTQEAADRLVCGDKFKASDNDDEWFGEGVYFWEYAPKQAFKKHPQPAVVGAMIRLGNCFDLLDPKNISVLKAVHKNLIAKMEADGIEVPVNERQHRNLDCAVFNFLYLEAQTAGVPIDSARGVYVPRSTTKRVWRGSWVYDEAHIQICIRNARNILAVWHVRPDGRYGKPAQETKEPG